MKKEVLKKLGDHVPILDSDEEEEVLEDKFNSMVQSAVERVATSISAVGSTVFALTSKVKRHRSDFKSLREDFTTHKRSVEEGTKIQEAKKDAVGYGLQDWSYLK